jgi:hypothetical protein
MDGTQEASWAQTIRTAVREFVDAVNESSKQLAGASERFAIESLNAAEAARSRSEQSATKSAEMAQQAQQAAEEARNAAAGLQSAIEEAREQVRNDARLSLAEQVTEHTARITEVGEEAKNDLQRRIDEMVVRLESGSAGHQQALETAQAATTAAQEAASRIEASVNAVEAAVTSAREAAEEARKAATQSEQSAGNVTQAVASAQEAAESSRQSASLAEQAGQRSDFAAEASMLLERLETDYSLLTRLVQELHSRISSLSAVSVAATPAPAETAPVAGTAQETPETPTVEEQPETPSVIALPEAGGSLEATQPVTDFATQQVEAGPVSPWPSQPPADLETVAAEPSTTALHETPDPVTQPAAEVKPEPVKPTAAITIFGRIQMTISPVPDFDRLLSLDSALARVGGVRSVTLADYAREEVIFRVELERPVSVVEFANQLSDTAGIGTEVTEATETALSIRVS